MEGPVVVAVIIFAWFMIRTRKDIKILKEKQLLLEQQLAKRL